MFEPTQLSNGLRAALSEIAKPITLKTNDHFALNSLTATGISYFKSGTAVVTMQTSKTKTINNMVFGEGDWFGDYQPTKDSGLSFKFHIWADTEILHFDNDKIGKLISSELEVYKWLYSISINARPKWLQAQLIGSENKEVRVVYLLFELVVHNYAYSKLSIPISQQTLSDMIGISRQRVNEVLIDLQLKGYLKLGRNSITLIDLRGLEAVLDKVELNFRDPRKLLSKEQASLC